MQTGRVLLILPWQHSWAQASSAVLHAMPVWLQHTAHDTAVGPAAGCQCRHELTAAGFRYLLKTTNEQVWVLLREYIKTAEQTSGEVLAGTAAAIMGWSVAPLPDRDVQWQINNQ